MYVIDQVRDPDSEDSWISGLEFRQTVAGLTPVSYTHLDVYKRQQVNIPLKAVVTPTSKSWVFGDLLAHLQEEHTAFTAAKETAKA